jgi:quercetin dioxygenase-like cupin family protein
MTGMMSVNRRDLLEMFSALAVVGVAETGLAEAQGAAAARKVLDKSQAFAFDTLPMKTNATGGVTRAVVQGALVTGEVVEVHETTLPPGQMPHPAHKHRHSEFMMIREGTVEFDMDGTKQTVGPGGVLFAASGVMHGLKNVGEVKAQYFVIAIGTEVGVDVA